MTDLVRATDLERASDVLARAFSAWEDASDWSEEVLRSWWRWRWEGGLSVRSSQGDGFAFADWRSARFRSERLRVVHIGPVGVLPERQRQGVGLSLLAAIEKRARAEGADVLTLTTESRQPAQHLYHAAGYTVLEAVHPGTLVIDGAAVAEAQGLGWLSWAGRLLSTRADAGEATVRPLPRGELLDLSIGPGRPRAIREEALPVYPEATGFEAELHGVARVSIAAFPVVTGSRRRKLRVAQILGVRGEGAALSGAVAAAVTWARDEGCITAFAMPAAGVVPGFKVPGPEVLRFVRPLNDRTAALLSAARAWDERAPAS